MPLWTGSWVTFALGSWLCCEKEILICPNILYLDCKSGSFKWWQHWFDYSMHIQTMKCQTLWGHLGAFLKSVCLKFNLITPLSIKYLTFPTSLPSSTACKDSLSTQTASTLAANNFRINAPPLISRSLPLFLFRRRRSVSVDRALESQIQMYRSWQTAFRVGREESYKALTLRGLNLPNVRRRGGRKGFFYDGKRFLNLFLKN